MTDVFTKRKRSEAGEIELREFLRADFGGRSVGKMNVENLQIPVREVIPELDGESAEDVNVHAPPG